MSTRIGLLGIGFMGKTHADIYLKNSKAKLVAYCDSDPKKAAGDWSGGGGNLGDAFGKAFDPKTLTSHRTAAELFADPHVDLVDICLPTYLHGKHVIAALAAGKHVLCEKPLSTDPKEAQAVAAAAKKAKGNLMVAQCMRFWPEWEWLKQAVQRKAYGKVHSAVFRRFASTPTWTWNNWILNAKLSGSALFDLHIHDTDFVRYVFGEPRAVFSVGNGGKATKGGIDHIVTSYLYKNKNLLVSAEGGWNADPTYGFTMRYTVVFEKATVDFDLGREGKVLLLHKTGAKEPEVVACRASTGWADEVDYFLECLARKQKPKVTTPEDAARSVALVQAELKSVRTRKVVPFKP
ncbi:MAG: Gfo/Idh/MocA family oxidoreductase [Planctomycetota bacterium]|nr:Gfo/Idh/MocA family oxidoreductase [Planctomycetota bacterium]